MKRIFFLILFLTIVFIISSTNYIGITNQIDFNIYGHSGWRSSVFMFSCSPLLGLSHTIEISKRFSIENNFLFGYKYNYHYSSYGISSTSNFHGFHFITNMNFLFRFGSDKIKFKFSVPSWIFSFSIGLNHTATSDYYYDEDKNENRYTTYYSSSIYYFIYGGIRLIYVGINLYLGKENNILFTPVFLYGDLLWGSWTYIIPVANFGLGISLKFKINKKNISSN